MWNTCIKSGGGGMLSERLGNSFVSVLGSNLEVRKEYVGRTLVDI